MTDNFKNLNEFLKKYKLKKGDKSYTHTAIGDKQSIEEGIFPASYSIPNNQMDIFYNLYYKHVFVNGNKAYLTEKHLDYSPILIDLDFRFPTEVKDRKYTDDTIQQFLKLYISELKNLVELDESKLVAFVLEKSKPNCLPKKNVTKDGIHIILPYVITNTKIQFILRHKLINMDECKEIFNKIEITNTIDDIFDSAVIQVNNWQMYGSTKPRCETYKLSKIYSYLQISENFKEVPLETYSNEELVGLLSIRNKPEDSQPMICPNMINKIDKLYDKIPVKHRVRKAYGSSKNTIKKKKSKKKNVSDNLELVKKLVETLSPDRADKRDEWIRVGWCLHNIDHRLLDSWVMFSKKSSKYEEGCCEMEWDGIVNDGLGMGSLCLWAKEDNIEDYKSIISGNIRMTLIKSLTGTHHDIAKVIYQKFKHEFVCASSRRKCWYQFVDHKWKELDCDVELRRLISNDIVNEYLKLGSDISKKASEMDEDDCQKEVEMDRVKKLNNIAIQLRKTSFKKNVLEECLELFYIPKFEELLDIHDHLIGFENGVYDLDKGEFRDGLPEDYIKRSTGIHYEEFDEEDELFEDIKMFIRQVLPIDNVRKYVLTLLSSFLTGKTGEEKFHIWTGSGGNGKSKLIELFELGFGDYCCTLPVTILTQQRSRAEACNPALARTKGCRFCCLQEPDHNEELRVGQMKELTGGDTIIARTLHKEPIEFKPQFKLVLTCNDLPSVPSNDEGTWRRIRVVEFISKFRDSPDPNEPYHFPIDTNLSEKLREWAEPFMYLLLQYYKDYKENGIYEPAEVKRNTDEYHNESDIFTQFMNEKIIELDSNYEGSGIKLDDAYFVFQEWYKQACGSNNKTPSRKDLKKNMCNKYGKCNNVKSYWKGITFRNDDILNDCDFN